MDKLVFVVLEREPYHFDHSISCYDIVVQINDEVFNHIPNLYDILPLTEVSVADIDLFTCSCGVPGCAGFEDTVSHVKQDNTVIWSFPKERGYVTNKQKYTFDLRQFDQAIHELTKTVRDLENQQCYHVSTITDVGDDEPRITKVDEWLQQGIQQMLKWQEFHYMLQEHFPHMMGHLYCFAYDGKPESYVRTFGELIIRVLNNGPTSDDAQDDFLVLAEEAGFAIEQALAGNMTKIIEIVERVYSGQWLTPPMFVETLWWGGLKLSEEINLSLLTLHKRGE